MQNNAKHLLVLKGILSCLLGVSLVACNNGGSNNSSGGGGSGGNQGDASQLTFVAPNIIPSLAGNTNNSYVVVNNPTDSIITGIKYTLGDLVGDAKQVTLDPTSSANCAKVAANSSCSIKLTVAANSLAGSFSISADNKNLLKRLNNKLISVHNTASASNLPTSPTIGIGQVLYTTTSGANGVTLYYYNTVVAGVPMILVTGVVSSDKVGNLNNVVLIDSHNTPLPNQQVISGNLGAGAANLGLGSSFSILLPVPAGSGATQTIKVKTEQVAADGTVSNPQISTSSNTLTTTTEVGVVNMLPSAVYLTESNPEQQITFSNTGDAAAQLQSLVAGNPNISVSFNQSSLTPNGTTTATLKLINTKVPATTSSLTLSYNNGQSTIQQSANVAQNIVPSPSPAPSPTPTPKPSGPTAGLTATMSNNNFNVTTANSSTTQVMVLTNSGSTNEDNFVVTLPSHFTLVDSVGSVTDCIVSSGAIDPTQSLTPAGYCNVTVQYNNSTVSSGTDNISIAYKYNNGIAAPTPTTAAVNWQVTQSTANLVVTGSVPQPYVFPTTLVDGSPESTTYVFTIQNTGEVDATSIAPVVNSTTAGVFSANNGSIRPQGAVCGNSLAVSTTCELGVKFGPIPDNTAAGTSSGSLTINYAPYVDSPLLMLTQNVQGQVANSGSAVFNTPSSGGASGFTNNTWASLSIGQNTSTGQVTYTLTNSGSDDATDFAVMLPSAPTGWSQISTTCPTTTPAKLAKNSSCNVVIKPNTAASGSIAATNFTLGLAWKDQANPSGTTQNMQINTPTVTVVGPPNVTITSTTRWSTIMGSAYAFTATITGGSSTVTPTIGSSLGGSDATPASCNLDSTVSGMESCVFIIAPYTATSREGNNYSFWDPTNITNSSNVSTPSNAYSSSSISLSVSTTNSATVNAGASPQTFSNISGAVTAPYIYLPAVMNGSGLTGVTWGTGGKVSTRFTGGTNPTGGPCPGGQAIESDNLTGLTWVESPTSTTYTWANAKAKQPTLGAAIPNNYCGYYDWRLPTITELLSLVNYSTIQDPNQWLNNNGFTNVMANIYWSSTSLDNVSTAWYVDFSTGFSYVSDFTPYYVWPVRGGQN